MGHLADRGTGLAIGLTLDLLMGAGIRNPGADLVLGVALGSALEVDGRRRRERSRRT